jgi:4-carboxymuconolactone decarboxylase
MSQAWRVMAQRLSQSWQTVPHFYLTRDVDAAALHDWRSAAEAEASVKVTYTDLLVKIVATCLRAHPRLNAAWIEDDIQANEHINVGLAVAVEDGLLVPVIHDADTMSVAEIAAARSRIVARAQTGKLSTRDLQGGTFTIRNLGMYGIDAFSAIVNPPQAAILAVGRIADRVVPVQGKPAVRPQMTLTLSLDHRVVDGVRGAQFLETVVNAIEERRSPKKRESGMTDEKFEQGMQIRRQVLGDAHVDRAEANKTAFDADFQRFITETAWGAVWARPSLDKKTRHLLTIAMLAALGKEHELTMHIRATKNTGVTAEEVKEVLLQVAIYAGVPAANSAIAAAKKVYQQEEGEG